MNKLVLAVGLAIGGVFLASAALMHSQEAAPPSGPPYLYNPKAFQETPVSPSEPFRFLLSEQGKQLLRLSSNPQAKGFLELFGEDVNGPVPVLKLFPEEATGPEAAASSRSGACSGAFGAVFNREPGLTALPQNEESIDFLVNRVGTGLDLVIEGANDRRGLFSTVTGFNLPWTSTSLTGYYVHTSSAADCSVQFEGGLPDLVDPATGKTVSGFGDPVVSVDSGRDAVFMADLRIPALGVFRTQAATLLNPAACPAGTHTEAQAENCWEKSRGSAGIVLDPPVGFIADKPHLVVDERTSGTTGGPGNVYVSETVFPRRRGLSIQILLTVCKNDLSACSSPVLVSDPADNEVQFSHMSVRPDGNLSVTYINLNTSFATPAFDIKYVACTTSPAPAAPVCGSAHLVNEELQPLEFGGELGANNFRTTTYPKHDHQVLAGGVIETYVVWERCKVNPNIFGSGTPFICPDADVVMATSTDNGVSWSSPIAVDTGVGDQFFPWLKTDRSTNIVNIVYYNSSIDSLYHRRLQLLSRQILPTSPGTVTTAQALTTGADDPTGDVDLQDTFFGDYIGVAARGTGTKGQSRAYAGWTSNGRLGLYGGRNFPNQDNYVTRVSY